jgi:hypothetical protein
MQYLSIFLKTAAAIALTVLVGAQTLEWTNADAIASATVVAWGLIGAVIAGLLAVGWAFVTSPATTPLGKATRSAIQALLATPLAGVVIDSMDDVRSLGNLVVPTVASVVLAFAISYLSNRSPVPMEAKPALADLTGR